MAEAATSGSLPIPTIHKVDLDRPWVWLSRGWDDVRSAPSISLGYGIAFAIFGWIATFGLWLAGALYLILPMAAGFLIVGPILAVGLYEVSRARIEGRPVTLSNALAAYRSNPTQIAFMGVTLLLLFIAWVRIAVLIFFLFFGLEPPNPEAFVGTVFFSAGSLPFLIVGTAVGAVLSACAFTLSAFSIPYLLDKPRGHVMTAIGTSFKAISENPRTMAFWAILIAGFMAAGLVTFYIGLIVTLPLIGHATWHAYQDVTGEAA